jgi:hypothetical protein
MRVKCVGTTAMHLPEEYLRPPFGSGRGREFRLTLGREYDVSAFAFDAQGAWYFVVDDDELWYPRRLPAPLFEVTDGRLPATWRFSFTPSNSDHLALIAPKPWTDDEYFYDRLTDREARAVEEFTRFRGAIDPE